MQKNFYGNKKSLLKLLLISTIILYMLLYSPQKNTISGDPLFNNDELISVYFPNTSDGEITINTPENKTYTEPDSGYYLGSFGFEDSLPGTIPDGWYTRSSGDGYYEIDHLLEGHYNVYEIRKSGDTNKVETYKILPQSATIGTIEFWLYKDTDSSIDPTRITLRDEPTGGYIPFGIENEDLFIGKWSEKIYTFNNVFSKNEWHHIRVDFDLSVGWQLKLDDTWYGAGHAFTVYASDHPPPSKINTFHVESIYSGDNPSYGAWFDAISYSWDSNYNSGDNLNEGLLLSYDNSTNLDWQGYSLDGQANKTILGNTTILMPNEGLHRIQVFGNDSLGALYESGIRYFTVKHITISTPENKTYTEPMEGYYPGTIGFEHEKDGTTGTDIDFVDIDYSGSNCVPRIISGLDGHEKVLQMDDDSASEQVDIRSLFDVTQESGTIELYWKSTNVSKICYFDVRSGDAAKIRIAIWQDKFQYWDGTYHDIVGAVSDTWYRLRIDFESGSGGYEGLSADTYFIYINEVKYGPYNFESSVDYLDDIRITTHDAGTGYDNYFDAIGYSWDPTYNIGDNLKEGLLLSFENSTNLDWIGYSLDGQSNKTILGDTTITMPNDGSHTIQVFGNDSLGTIYSSDIRYFSVDTLDPVITINSPLTGEVFTDLPPEFNLTIDEVNLDTTWYTLDGGATTIDFMELTGYIDLTAWNNAPIGNVTIRFYARDKAGNEVYQEVIVIKSSSQQEPPPEIQGFNIALLCLTIVIITVSSLKIKKYKVK